MKYLIKADWRDEENPKSALGAGTARIFRSEFIDSLAYFKNKERVYVAKDLEHAKQLEAKGNPTVLIVQGPLKVLWAVPVVNGELRVGMHSGSFIWTTDGLVMKNYSHPIRLMDRFER